MGRIKIIIPEINMKPIVGDGAFDVSLIKRHINGAMWASHPTQNNVK